MKWACRELFAHEKNQIITDKEGFPKAMVDYSLQYLWKEYCGYKQD